MTYEECRLRLEDIFDESVIMLKGVCYVEYYLKGSAQYTIVVINSEKLYEYQHGLYGREGIGEFKRKEMLTMFLELAGTPLDERTEQNKYQLRHKYLKPNAWSEGMNYLNKGARTLMLASAGNFKSFQVVFTKEEIEKMKKEFDTDFKDFEIIEVED